MDMTRHFNRDVAEARALTDTENHPPIR